MNYLTKENITLQEGLEKFYENYQQGLSHTTSDLPKDVKDFFKSHDIAHVLFGCDISLFGEGSVKIWTIYGTTLGFWNHILEYRKANAFELYKKLPLRDSVKDLFKLIVSTPVLIIRARRMNKPWPWKDFKDYLDKPISEIRREFNIKVLK